MKKIYIPFILIIVLAIGIILFNVVKVGNLDEVVNENGDTQLMESIRCSGRNYKKYNISERDLVFELIEKGANINVKNNYDETPLMLAVDEGDLEMVEALLDKGTDINAQRKAIMNLSNKPNYSHEGNTALFSALVLAVKEEGSDMLEFLLEKGADSNIKNKEGETVLHWVSMFNQKECIKLLMDYGADVNAIDNEGNTPLISACLAITPDIENIKILLDTGAEINAVNNEGNTVLLCIASSTIDYDTEIIDFLINAGANTTIKNKDDKDFAYYEKEYEEYLAKKREDKIKEKYTKEEPRIGMTAEEVENSTWGKPDKINKTTTEYGVSEQWVYDIGKYIYLDNGIVTAIQDFE